MSETRYSLGIDPGWKNLGLALVKEDVGGTSLVLSQTLNPHELGGYIATAKHIQGLILEKLGQEGFDQDALASASIERYVSYNNVMTAESENIVVLIGAIVYMLTYFPKSTTHLYRAIDWKTQVVKLLVKHKGFDNPSQSLDKKFSIAAAHACLDKQGEFNNDHEADATVLASIDFLKSRYAKQR